MVAVSHNRRESSLRAQDNPDHPAHMITTLASALRAKQKANKFTLPALAKAIGANAQSVTAALTGKSVPNATTAPRYAKFLGITIEEFTAMVKPGVKATKQTKPAKKGRKAKKAAKATSVAAPAKPAKTKQVTLAEAVELAGDDLAVEVHRATAVQRRVIVAVLGA